ncbi:MAG TPA: hypothetical protein VNW92_11325 [Polyangiaceae bacterium]|nr:hypothetical protein [Polyangiaceae bacterium]
MIGEVLARGSLTRRIATRAVVVFGAVWLGALITRSLPHDQILVFPVGSTFPNATRFSASWRQAGDSEPRGGVTLSFSTPPPLQIRQHADVPNGNYLVSIEVVVPGASRAQQVLPEARENPQNAEVSRTGRGLQTNIERRVTLAGGETVVALAAGGF